MAISHLFPEEGPTLNLNFAGSRTLDPRITFSRSQTTSNGSTYMDQNGLIRYAGPDEPRFDHRYVNGEIESLGLLVEEQRTNLILYSNDFSQSNWTKQNNHPTPSKNAIGPDGVANSASTVYRTATNQYVYQSILGAGTYTLSAWVKSEAATGSFTMQGYNGIDGGMGSVTHTATNEWQRFETTISPTHSSTNYYPCIPTNTNTNFYVWGVQVESGSFKTSYIPTEGSTKTRNPDNVSMTGTNFSDWYNQSEGTFVTLHRQNDANDTTSNYGIYSLSNSPTNTDRLRFFSGAGRSPVFNTVISSSNVSYVNTGSLLGINLMGREGELIKSSTRYSDIECSVVIEGSDLATDDTDIVIPSTLNNMIIGAGGGLKQLCGHISQLTYYPTRLTNSQLQNLTK